jgi:predicted permease
MILESFRITGLAVAQIFLLAAIGYFLVKKDLLGAEGLDSLSRLAIEITLPLLIFCQLIKDFNFTLYVNWWLFPLISIAIAIAGSCCGLLFTGFIKGLQYKLQFLSLVTFQNSGYLPLMLIAALLPADKAGVMFIYLFLFLTAFNLVMFSAGVHMLCFHKNRKFELASLFSPPVIATIFSLAIIFFGLNKFIPDALLKPLRLLGECTLPLGLLVVGGNLAQISLARINKKEIFFLVLAKLILLPALGLWLVVKLRPPELIGLLIIVQLAMPPATTLSVIIRHYKKEDLLISQGIFFGHVLSLLTLPVILSLYFMLFMIK